MRQTVEVSFDSPLSHAFNLQEISLLACLSVSGAPAHVSLQSPDPTGSPHLFSAGFGLLVSTLKPLPLTAVSQQLKGFCFRFCFQKSFHVCVCLWVRMCACAHMWGPTEDLGALGMAAPSLHPQRDFVKCWLLLSTCSEASCGLCVHSREQLQPSLTYTGWGPKALNRQNPNQKAQAVRPWTGHNSVQCFLESEVAWIPQKGAVGPQNLKNKDLGLVRWLRG